MLILLNIDLLLLLGLVILVARRLVRLWAAHRAGTRGSKLHVRLAILFGAIYPQLSDPTAVTITGFLLVTAIYVMVAIAWGMYVPELFPTSIRMRGAGFCNTLGRFMTILTPQITTVLFASAGIVAVLAFVVGLLLLQVIVVLVFGIETKKMSLEALSEAVISRNKTGSVEPALAAETRTS